MASSRSAEKKIGWEILNLRRVRWRAWGMCFLLLFTFLGLGARLWYLQILEGEKYLSQAQRNSLRRVPLPAPRGMIIDRRGQILATSRAAHAVAVVPAALPSARKEPEARGKVLRTLAYLLEMSPDGIEEKIAAAAKKGAHSYDPVRILERAELETITLVEENKPRLGPAVLITDEVTRFYPNGALAAHVIGYTGAVTEGEMKSAEEKSQENSSVRRLRHDDSIGKIGVEKFYDARLAGIPGSALYEVDARSQPVRRLGKIAERAGSTLVLTIDSRLQRAAENALSQASNSGAAVAVDVRSGEILALASNPTFDPNIFSLPRYDPKRQKELQRLLESNVPASAKQKYFYNRAVTSHYSPGSTYKMITAAAGLEKGVSRPDTPSYRCGGGLRMGRFFGCWSTHGTENLMSAMAKSCNVYFYQTALRLGDPQSSGPEYLAKISRQFGLGNGTGIDLPTDGKGLVPDPEWRRAINKTRPDLAHWYPGNTLNMSIGQGDVLATPLQMALATAAIANGGTLWKPHLMKEMRSAGTEPAERFESAGKTVDISAGNIEIIRRAMRGVVTNGTGRSINLPQVTVAGKTGSAEDGKQGLPHAWWVCFAPYENPQIAIAVIVENSGHGSENALPVARQILEAAFPLPQ